MSLSLKSPKLYRKCIVISYQTFIVSTTQLFATILQNREFLKLLHFLTYTFREDCVFITVTLQSVESIHPPVSCRHLSTSLPTLPQGTCDIYPGQKCQYLSFLFKLL